MNQSLNTLDDILGIADIVETTTSTVTTPKIPITKMNDEDINDDYKYQRENLYTLVERGQDAIEGILHVARESDQPRAYEVAGNLIKNVADTTEKLIVLQEKMKKMKEGSNTGPRNVTNALYVGSTADLQKLLKGKKENASN
tara:strand:- start:2030 stop:2455 length:426 start_codon:yes stop_codon:yes gene_type:complete